MRRTALLGGLAAINLAAGFFAQWLVFGVIGAGRATDALFATMAFPQLIFTLVQGPISNVLVPILAQAPDTHRHRASALALAIGLMAVPFVAVLFVAAPVWVPLLLPGFEGEDVELIVRLTRIQLVGLLFSLEYGVVWASAIARGRFVATEAALTVAGVVSFLAVYPAASQYGVEGAAYVFAGRSALRVVAMAPFSEVRGTLTLRGAQLRALAGRVMPLAAAGAYHKSEVILDQYLASLAPAGALSLFNLAQTLLNAGVGIVNRAFFVPLAPRFGQLAGEEKIAEVRSLARTQVLVACGLGGLGALTLLVLGRPVLGLLVGHGGVTAESVGDLWRYALALTGVLVGLTAGQVVAFSMHALGATRQLSVLSAVAFTAGIGFKVLGFAVGGVFGLGLGTSAYVLFALLLTATALRGVLRARYGASA